MIIGVSRESFPDERRVALTPAVLPALIKAGHQVQLEPGAGQNAGYPDAEYVDKGATLAQNRDALFRAAAVVVQVRTLGANPEAGRDDLARLREGQVLIGTADPLGAAAAAQELAGKKITLFALELMPRITRAQSMDVLSSQASLAGYQAVLEAARRLPRMFPMMMTAAGTIAPARVFVVGAGVAGLQAIATARRLGAVVEAYDVRPAVKEQVESLGARFVQMELDAGDAEDKGGYARAMDQAFYQKQRELMAEVVARSDVVITTAAIPGRDAPLLITADAVRGMPPGSVVIDLAAERGGNVEPSRPDEVVLVGGVTVLGPTNLPSLTAYHASQMYGKNLASFLLHLAPEGELKLDLSDEITAGTLVARGGEVVHPRLREILGLPAPEPEAS